MCSIVRGGPRTSARSISSDRAVDRTLARERACAKLRADARSSASDAVRDASLSHPADRKTGSRSQDVRQRGRAPRGRERVPGVAANQTRLRFREEEAPDALRAREEWRELRVERLGEHVRRDLHRHHRDVPAPAAGSLRSRRVPLGGAFRAARAGGGRGGGHGVLRALRAQVPVAREPVDDAPEDAQGVEPAHLAAARVASPPARGRLRGE